jgi:hypothetical protein
MFFWPHSRLPRRPTERYLTKLSASELESGTPYHTLHSDTNGYLGSIEHCPASRSFLEINRIITGVLVDPESLSREVRRLGQREPLSWMPRPPVRCWVQRTPVGQPALIWRGSTAALPLLVEHSQISGLGGQRLVSVIQ